MRVSKYTLLLIIILSISILLVACGGNKETNSKEEDGDQVSSEKSDEEITLRLGTLASNPDGSLLTSFDRFAQDMEEATDGRVKIEIYPGAQLGGEVEMTEQVQLGSLDMASITSNTLANYVEELFVIEMPFLFKNRDEAWEALDGSVGEKLSQKADDAGFINLGYWDVGFKNISNNKKEIQNVDDIKGMDIRVGQSNLLTDTYNALEANPTPIAYPEVYTSIQQGIIDGFEGAYQPFEDAKLFEVQDYLSEIQISYHTNLFLISKSVFEELDAEAQDILVEMANKQTKEQRAENIEIEKEQRKLVKGSDVEVLEYNEIDIESFQKATESVYEKYDSKLGGLLSEIESNQ